ncbi:MAG: hypothetical protein M3433_07360 [Actinomycetota bacterium]|nr:hypothetical protein [Actinomycetota bacterium]MDQ3648386.1 hypothetical protein [Actinomycetota bacterium]
MARNERYIPVSLHSVFEVLADARHVHLFTRLRNRETLRRLAEVAEASPAERERLAREEPSAE